MEEKYRVRTENLPHNKYFGSLQYLTSEELCLLGPNGSLLKEYTNSRNACRTENGSGKKKSKNSQTVFSVSVFCMLNLYTNKSHLLKVTGQANVNVKTTKNKTEMYVFENVFCLKEAGCFSTVFLKYNLFFGHI